MVRLFIDRASRRSMLLSGAALLGGLFATQAYAQSTPAAPPPAAPTASSNPSGPMEVVVTANRRTQNVVDIPYNISAVSGAQVVRTGAVDLASLSQQIPNFTLQDRGPGAAVTTTPIIRGLNASLPDQDYIPSAQSPVGFYIGNAPVFGYFPLDDVQRVEVLRGPQGTLYGVGSLAGTVRVIPNDPALGVFSGNVGGSAGGVFHSTDADYSGFGLINLPIGDTLAIRADYRYEHDAGFIDQFEIIARQGGNYLNGLPILTNPSDVANSTAVHFNKDNVNFSNTSSGRIALLWKPTDKLRIELAYNFSRVNGDGYNQENPTYGGGINPIDGRTVFPATGNYDIVLTSLQPWERLSQMGSADVSYDLGFATLSSTSSYYRTSGWGVVNSTLNVWNNPSLAFALGSPVNPRFVYNLTYPDFDWSFTQEVRLVSRSGGPIDYVLGGFYQNEQRGVDWASYAPGENTQQAAAGSSFPSLADGQTFSLHQRQKYEDTSIFGELTWHVTDKLQVTGGARFFWENFDQSVTNDAILYGIATAGTASSSISNHLVKFNIAYEYLPDQHVYATFSQGFRRGGANAFPLSGVPFGEPAAILKYLPDFTNNYEAGLKGRLPFGATYSVDGFYVDWSNPQIETSTPNNGWPVVINGAKAASTGTEAEIDGPLIIPRLTYSVGFAYAHAVLTKSFCLPAGTFDGPPVACGINGLAGDRLPGSPEYTASGTLNYDQDLSGGADILYTINANYIGSIVNTLPAVGITPVTLPGYTIVNASATYRRDRWELMAYVKNLFNTRALLDAPDRSYTIVGNLANVYTVNRPLEGGIQLKYSW